MASTATDTTSAHALGEERVEGTIASITERGFGFISDRRQHTFFHASGLRRGVSFTELKGDGTERVTYQVERDEQGRTRAVDVSLLDDDEAVPQWSPASAAAQGDDNVYDWEQQSA